MVLNKLKSSGLPCYFTIGNHNTDRFAIDEVIKFFDLKKSYYSFIKENIKFIILDSNFIKKKDGIVPYYKKNYDKTTDDYPYITDEEITWLKEELADNEMNVTIQGMNGHYQKHSPKDIGIGNTWNGVSIEARTPSAYIQMKG